jgi:hypothetical protein
VTSSLREIRVQAQRFDSIDRIVVCNRHQVHAAALENLINRQRRIVAFSANPVQNWHGTHAGMAGMYM